MKTAESPTEIASPHSGVSFFFFEYADEVLLRCSRVGPEVYTGVETW